MLLLSPQPIFLSETFQYSDSCQTVPDNDLLHLQAILVSRFSCSQLKDRAEQEKKMLIAMNWSSLKSFACSLQLTRNQSVKPSASSGEAQLIFIQQSELAFHYRFVLATLRVIHFSQIRQQGKLIYLTLLSLIKLMIRRYHNGISQ